MQYTIKRKWSMIKSPIQDEWVSTCKHDYRNCDLSNTRHLQSWQNTIDNEMKRGPKCLPIVSKKCDFWGGTHKKILSWAFIWF